MTTSLDVARRRPACDLPTCIAPKARSCGDCGRGNTEPAGRPVGVAPEPSTVLPEDFTRFHNTHRARFVAYARSRGVWPDCVEDVVHQAFVKLYHVRRFLEAENPRAFAFKVLHDTVVDFFRAEDRRRAVEEAAGDRDRSAVSTAQDPIGSLISRLDMEKALAQLPDRQADCVRLGLFMDLPRAEIAAWLNISESAVNSHISAGRKKMAAHLREYRAPVTAAEEGGTE